MSDCALVMLNGLGLHSLLTICHTCTASAGVVRVTKALGAKFGGLAAVCRVGADSG